MFLKVADNKKVIKYVSFCVIPVVFFLNVYIRSEGNDDPRMTPKKNFAYIFVNGMDYSPRLRGHNVVIVDAETGTVVLTVHNFLANCYQEEEK